MPFQIADDEILCEMLSKQHRGDTDATQPPDHLGKTKMRTLLAAAGIAYASAFTVGVPAAAPARATIQMGDNDKGNNTPAKFFPQGPFGGYSKVGEKAGWLGDNSKSLQVGKFEDGSDYLFFQGPAPKTAVQEDLPSLFSGENLSEGLSNFPPQAIVFAGTGVASLAAVGSVLVQ